MASIASFCGLFTVCIVLQLCSGSPVPRDGITIIETTKGKIQGLRKTFNGQKYDVFKGIPFAQPPVKNLRFERPKPAAAWEGVLATTNYSIACTQINKNITSEDCLYLNVFVPFGVENAKKLPVMVYAHGGAFLIGTITDYESEELAISGQVIVVSFQYRLSVLGGLATRDASSPGNYMLWDARAALIWIRENIARFGGDPSRVTAFGHSAGAVIVSHLAISPMTKGLMHRAIVMSGTSSSTLGTQYDSRQNAKNLASYEDCPTNDMRALVQCLRQRNAKDLDVSGIASMVLEGGTVPGWLPAIDGLMVPELPKDMWNKGAGSHVDYMIGRAHHDGAGFIYLNLSGEPRNDTINLAEDKELLDLIFTFLLQTYAKGDPGELVEIVKARYPNTKSDDVLKRTKAITKAGSDFIFASPAHFEAVAHSKNSKTTGKKTFLYNYKYRPSFVHYAPWVTGSHGDMLHFVFGEPYRREFKRRVLGEFTREDRNVKEYMMAYFANFAHTGDPNKGPHKIQVPWPEYTEISKDYLEMTAEAVVKKEDDELLYRHDFWLNKWPAITVPEKP